MHVSMNAQAETVTSLVVTGRNPFAEKQSARLVQKDREQALPAGSYAADRQYDDAENHHLLKNLGLQSTIRLNCYRTEQKDRNRQRSTDCLEGVAWLPEGR